MDVRKEVLEYGLLPSAIMLPKFDSPTAVTDFHSKLLRETGSFKGQRGFVSAESVRKLLNISPEMWSLVFSYLDSVSCRSARQQWRLSSDDETRIDLHALSLFLLTQVYGKQASKRSDYELKGSKEKNGNSRGMAPRSLNALTFSSFLRRHLMTLLYLIKDNPPELASPAWCTSHHGGLPQLPLNQDQMHRTIMISREEIDRLELLLCRRPTENGELHGGGGGHEGVAGCLACYKNHIGGDIDAASCVEVVTCLKASILDTSNDQDTSSTSGRICGTTKGTLVQGEDSFPDNQLTIHECQDSCIYALAPLARAKVTACSDCIIVLGPTTGCVIVENCTRIKLIFAATSTCITACHESTLHLATTRSPCLLGDNRFLQLAPFNIEYERLEEHLRMAGLETSPNLWDQPVILNPFKDQTRDEDGGGSGELADSAFRFHGCSASDGKNSLGQGTTQDLLLPPDQLLPFTVPFKGGPGPLAGGAPTNSQISWVNRLGCGMGSGPPFPLSPVYADALTARLRRVAELQETVGKAINDLNNRRDIQVAIQRYFKEWLFKTAKIRQVYDLAKLEQQTISETKSATSNPSSSDAKQ